MSIKKYIGIDLDGVLYSIHEDTIRDYNATKILDVELNQLTQYDLNNVPHYQQYFMRRICNKDFVKKQNTYIGACAFIENFSNKYHIVFMTSRPLSTAEATITSFFQKGLHHANQSSISFGKDHLTLPYYIEDNPEQVEKFLKKSQTRKVFLRNQPYNKNAKCRMSSRVIPFTKYDEVFQWL